MSEFNRPPSFQGAMDGLRIILLFTGLVWLGMGVFAFRYEFIAAGAAAVLSASAWRSAPAVGPDAAAKRAVREQYGNREPDPAADDAPRDRAVIVQEALAAVAEQVSEARRQRDRILAEIETVYASRLRTCVNADEGAKDRAYSVCNAMLRLGVFILGPNTHAAREWANKMEAMKP